MLQLKRFSIYLMRALLLFIKGELGLRIFHVSAVL